MAFDGKRDLDTWIRFVLSDGKRAIQWLNENQPLRDIVWFAQQLSPGKVEPLRPLLVAPLSMIKLTALYTQQYPTSSLLQSQDATDEQMKHFFSTHLSLDSLCDAFVLVQRENVPKLKEKIGTWILDALEDPLRALPATTSADLQKDVIERRCGLEAVWLKDHTRRKQLETIIKRHYHKKDESVPELSYLNLKKKDLCDLVAGINQITRFETDERIKQCNAVLETIPQDQKFAHLRKKLQDWNRIVQDWNAIYQCNRTPCENYLEQLHRVAEKIAALSVECTQLLLQE